MKTNMFSEKRAYIALAAIAAFFLFLTSARAQSFCDSTGNVVIYSNYDGGILRINVDMNVADLKIGIVSYENDSVVFSGPYVSNITKVIYAGYLNSNNVHCSPQPKTKTITGAPAGADSVIFRPPSVYSNASGNNNIVCNYSCNISSSQGGCNTADQIAEYFFYKFGTRKLLFHKTQYGCWSGTYNVSEGGNCCATGPTTTVKEPDGALSLQIYPNPTNGSFTLSFKEPIQNGTVKIFNTLGEEVYSETLNTKHQILNTHLPSGIYFVQVTAQGRQWTQKLVVQ